MHNDTFLSGLDEPGQHLYALYLPTQDQFLIVYHHFQILGQLQHLLSSKCHTLLVQISTAPEYWHGAVHNGCCGNWTVKNRHKIDFKSIGPNILDGSDLGLLQRTPTLSDPVSRLQSFALVVLQKLIQLERLEATSKDRLKGLTTGHPYRSSAVAAKLLPLHADRLSQHIQSSIDHSTNDIDSLRQHILVSCKSLLYWAHDTKEIADSWPSLIRPFANIVPV